MYPGNTYILLPPRATEPVLLPSLASGNGHGAVAWTDGKIYARMLLDDLWLMKSPADGITFWKEEAEVIGEFHPFSDEADKYIEYRHVKEPSERDYLMRLEEGGANTIEREKYVRQRLWWLGNDVIRKNGGMLIESHRKNLRRYIELLDADDDEERLAMAEALRELSEFEEAADLLEWRFPSYMETAASLITELVKQRNYEVAELKPLRSPESEDEV